MCAKLKLQDFNGMGERQEQLPGGARARKSDPRGSIRFKFPVSPWVSPGPASTSPSLRVDRALAGRAEKPRDVHRIPVFLFAEAPVDDVNDGKIFADGVLHAQSHAADDAYRHRSFIFCPTARIRNISWSISLFPIKLEEKAYSRL